MKILLLLILNMILLNAGTVWQGTIGKSPIFMQLMCSEEVLKKEPEKCYVESYMYSSTLQSITLNGDYNKTKKQFFLTVGTYRRVHEKFLLSYRNGELNGTWHHKNKTLKVNLKLYKEAKSFDEIRMKLFKFKREKVEKLANKKELVWIKEMFSNNAFFRLGNGFPQKSREQVNPLLDKLQKEYASSDLECFNSWSFGSGMESSSSANLQYISDKLLGFNIHVNYDCGGAHPDFFTARYTVDMASGKVYKLEDILSIAKDAKKIRALAFAEAGLKLEANNKEEQETYDPYRLTHWDDLKWDLTKTGIRFYLDFCSASRCFRGDYYEISFKRLKPYLSKAFLKRLDSKDVWVE